MQHRHTNRLARESSPYLLQHQHNPVDWYPWGEEAFAAARAQDKPIFLSVGYSTCYWCHVMERECFENEEIAKLMNEKFINIKVDREERPDVDQLYMTAVQVMTRSGGWPMSVWLLPDLRPFFGGTYFPPVEMHGRPSFPAILNGLADAFLNKRDQIEVTATRLTEVLVDLAQPDVPEEGVTLSPEWLEPMLARSINDYDPNHGGFGGAPKFPRETLLELLLHALKSPIVSREMKNDIERPLRHTLHAMANGGIRDQLGGAFHRYSTDAQWLVPHFEIMLYDNAMLAWVYAEAAKVLSEPRFANVARGICDFVLREMTSPEGAFYTAFDAEVDAHEGLNYLWTMEQLEQVLDPRQASQFAVVYGMDHGPNFADPHHSDGTPDRNVLYLARPEREDDPAIVEMRQKLYEFRQTRKKPLLDTKIITSWNALMIRGLARVAHVTGDEKYLDAAKKAARLLLDRHVRPDGGIYRTSRDGTPKYDGFLDDYAFLAQALMCLKETEAAQRVVDAMRHRFGDVERGGYFFSDVGATDLLARQKVASDSPIPAGNAVAAMVLERLGVEDDVRRLFGAFAEMTTRHGESMSAMLQAMLLYVEKHGSIRIDPPPPPAVPAEPPAVETPVVPPPEPSVPPASPADQAKDVLQIEHAWIADDTLRLTLRIAHGYHLSADHVEITSPAGGIESIDEPEPVERFFAYADSGTPRPVYEGSATWVLHLANPMSGIASLPLNVRYQPCTDVACLPTVSQSLNIRR